MKRTAFNSPGTRSAFPAFFGSARAGGTRGWAALLPAIAMLLYFACGASAEMPRTKGTGTLVSVGTNGTVIIAERGHAKDEGSQDSFERGYRLSPHAIILDPRGKRTSLDELELPTVVEFEYVFTREDGPEIQLIREMAQ